MERVPLRSMDGAGPAQSKCVHSRAPKRHPITKEPPLSLIVVYLRHRPVICSHSSDIHMASETVRQKMRGQTLLRKQVHGFWPVLGRDELRKVLTRCTLETKRKVNLCIILQKPAGSPLDTDNPHPCTTCQLTGHTATLGAPILSQICFIIPRSLHASNSGAPTISSAKIQAAAHMSTLGLWFRVFINSSGARYHGVTTLECSAIGSPLHCTDIPKSHSFSAPSEVNNTLGGFKS
jgi:hypothetical protein